MSLCLRCLCQCVGCRPPLGIRWNPVEFGRWDPPARWNLCLGIPFLGSLAWDPSESRSGIRGFHRDPIFGIPSLASPNPCLACRWDPIGISPDPKSWDPLLGSSGWIHSPILWDPTALVIWDLPWDPVGSGGIPVESLGLPFLGSLTKSRCWDPSSWNPWDPRDPLLGIPWDPLGWARGALPAL